MGVECDVKERGGMKKNEEIHLSPKKRSKKREREAEKEAKQRRKLKEEK